MHLLANGSSTGDKREIVTSKKSERARAVDPLRRLAEHHRLRSYRDACGDWNIPGRWGEICWVGAAQDEGPDQIGVQIGGPRANRTPAALPVGSNKRINAIARRWGPPHQQGDGEAVFILPAARVLEAARAIGARRRRTLSPAQQAAAIERLKEIQTKARAERRGENLQFHPAQEERSSS